MGTSFAVVFQTVGLAALLEAERAARSIAAHSPALVAAKRLELVAVGDAATLRGRSAGLTRAVDVAALVPAPLAARVAAAARRGGGACRRATCAVDDVRAVREARAAALPALLRAFAPLLALDADSVACGSLEPLLRWGAATPFDVALRPVPAAVAKGPARAVPRRVPEFNGGFLLLRNTSGALRFLERWRALYARSSRTSKHPTSDQPPLRAALWETGADYRELGRFYGCPAWADRAAACAGFAPDAAARKALARKKRQKLGGAHGPLWRAHVRRVDRGPEDCVLLHGAHLA